ncbi:alpha/beta hydrolase [Ktedonosporobacter rubrisoli]|uniref:Alpha/beta hydrolase n=1 Tax=Ktedonosporobacter rubrisoli TaxID=2509675 RepID=A0A4P6JK14_KTERU|nr:alpha/beta hydrolase [Ktedonosporobacter rubrisoli]QBD75302.1 alpha/beta hydrolase [Ktedonosporobacter rubrisoli]
MPISEHTVKTERHTTFYLAAGPENGPLVIFVHGWPELSMSWRHQLPALAALGFRAIAPDMRGYGRSSMYTQPSDYAQEHIVRDMLELVDALGREKAVWVGHDWGSAVVWNLASHHPDRCHAVASFCVPYYTMERGLDQLLALVDREVYPENAFPAGQWDYMRYYEESFAEAIAPMDANVSQFLKLLFRKGDPAGEGKPARTATARVFGTSAIPDLPRDDDVVNEEDLSIYVSALERNGFAGPSSWYLNHGVNAEYAMTAQNGGYLDMPVLFLNARYDYVCECTHSRLAEPMRTYCRNLTEETIRSGHWLAQEKPVEVNTRLVKWLAATVPDVWPQQQ